MISDSTLFYLYIVAVFAALVFGLSFWILRRGRSKKDISRSFNLKLFQVVLPKASPKEPLSLDQTRERIAIMEKLYGHLKEAVPKGWFWRVEPTFAFELTVPHIGEEIIFYVAVPKILSQSISKIIEGVFPDAQVTPARDYNIFNPDGTAVGAVLNLGKNDFLPIRTYRTLEADPLGALSNAFSKLAGEGEGAVFQIVVRPAPDKFSKEIFSFAKKVFSRGSFEKPGAFSEVMGELFGSSSPKKETKEEPRARALTPKEEEMVKAIENKGSKPLFEANIRLIASAASEARAFEILKNIETTFLQFEDPALNKFVTEEVKGAVLKNLFYQFSFRMFNESNAMILGSEELTSLLHFPNVPLETPKVKTLKSKEAPPPANLPRAGLALGYSLFRGEETTVRITPEDRRRHFYIIGQTGTGKTAFMENMIRQDIEAGKGVCFIDPHGDTVEKILGLIPPHRLDDVIYFNPGDTAHPMGLNMLEYDPRYPEQKTFVVNELFSIFQKLYGAVPESMGPMFEQYFRNATMLVMDDPSSGNTLLEISRVMSDKEFRDYKISKATNVVVKNFWTQVAEKAGGEGELKNMVPYITSKFDVFLANEIMRPIIAQEKSAFNFREVMDNQKILLINLSKGRLGDLNSSLIGLIMVGKILMAALSRVDIADQEARKDFYLYIDEFQNITTKSISTILSEARKYRLDLVIAHQFIGQLEEDIKKAVFGNVGSMVSFRIGSDDAEFISKQFMPVFGPEDLLNVDNYNAFIKLLINGQTSRPFNIRTYAPVSANMQIAETVKNMSQQKYSREREEVEREVMSRYR
ncbi:MAG: type IV secretion system DNA-binding domain-containing protein [bacterium]|nr:type IV secretion system DNA-binding domain-containing protein [bacterium]